MPQPPTWLIRQIRTTIMKDTCQSFRIVFWKSVKPILEEEPGRDVNGIEIQNFKVIMLSPCSFPSVKTTSISITSEIQQDS